jgi:hypothetical protein
MTIKRLRRLLAYLLHFLKIIGGWLGFALSFFRRRQQIVDVWPKGQIELGEDVALFIHFDRRQSLGEHVLGYIRELHACGFSVVFITNSGVRHPGSVAALHELCSAVVVRRNVGYDFGAIRDALRLLGLPRQNTDQLLIANDSVYGPLVPLAYTLARMNFNESDVWGATESWQIRYHLQSYFLLVGRNAMQNPAWHEFWRRVRQVSSKNWVVSHYEVGLTQRLLQAGLRCRSLWRYQDLIDYAVKDLTTPPGNSRGGSRPGPDAIVRTKAAKFIRLTAAAGKPMNPTAELWRQLLLTGFPFLKIELLRENPADVSDVSDWRSVVSHLDGVDITIIERDLQQRMRNRSP